MTLVKSFSFVHQKLYKHAHAYTHTFSSIRLPHCSGKHKEKSNTTACLVLFVF
uniref:Uncharacterized protein n=1 Tax=Anguilla anguilla TaxID=7936 RepID=A0A0E9TPP5_ANGAN